MFVLVMGPIFRKEAPIQSGDQFSPSKPLSMGRPHRVCLCTGAHSRGGRSLRAGNKRDEAHLSLGSATFQKRGVRKNCMHIERPAEPIIHLFTCSRYVRLSVCLWTVDCGRICGVS